MRRFISMVLRSLVSTSKARPWLQKRARVQGKEDQKLKVPHGATKMILTVFLSDNQQLLTEVPITPETLCKDVVEFCKEAGESGCHLAEVWRGKERAIPFDQLMFEHLQKWGQRRQEVKFYLRHEESPIANVSQGSQTSEQADRKSKGNSDKPCENGVRSHSCCSQSHFASGLFKTRNEGCSLRLHVITVKLCSQNTSSTLK
ncbi:apoptosis-stimulating of p53 protein 1-like isoform X2 [Sinocyclocheilus anshuiensis]|uniref:apoptosis-stimulating of p53 protein 1-like isoform X2 n=1 Tax=Sinocyclocheilus anshuiensis TaxID=1608454 RepID=UPI0007B9EBC5|nr:PREDICTED: apoptosis-stimulating of p53 protein 1-like isoform X2 [Sinocyclocheilus anshuiensis]